MAGCPRLPLFSLKKNEQHLWNPGLGPKYIQYHWKKNKRIFRTAVCDFCVWREISRCWHHGYLLQVDWYFCWRFGLFHLFKDLKAKHSGSKRDQLSNTEMHVKDQLSLWLAHPTKSTKSTDRKCVISIGDELKTFNLKINDESERLDSCASSSACAGSLCEQNFTLLSGASHGK